MVTRNNKVIDQLPQTVIKETEKETHAIYSKYVVQEKEQWRVGTLPVPKARGMRKTEIRAKNLPATWQEREKLCRDVTKKRDHTFLRFERCSRKEATPAGSSTKDFIFFLCNKHPAFGEHKMELRRYLCTEGDNQYMNEPRCCNTKHSTTAIARRTLQGTFVKFNLTPVGILPKDPLDEVSYKDAEGNLYKDRLDIFKFEKLFTNKEYYENAFNIMRSQKQLLSDYQARSLASIFNNPQGEVPNGNFTITNDKAIHHLYSRLPYIPLVRVVLNMLQIDKILHDGFHGWTQGMSTTPEDFIHYLQVLLTFKGKKETRLCCYLFHGLESESKLFPFDQKKLLNTLTKVHELYAKNNKLSILESLITKVEELAPKLEIILERENKIMEKVFYQCEEESKIDYLKRDIYFTPDCFKSKYIQLQLQIRDFYDCVEINPSAFNFRYDNTNHVFDKELWYKFTQNVLKITSEMNDIAYTCLQEDNKANNKSLDNEKIDLKYEKFLNSNPKKFKRNINN